MVETLGLPVLKNLEVYMGPSGLLFVWNVLHEKLIVSQLAINCLLWAKVKLFLCLIKH
jgi:hypothetical protein